ncbi:MAG: MerR family transcriptional regulator [Clostridia bacterium]|nr:MerR family transcriptional regulator [Clostridia bacterium]
MPDVRNCRRCGKIFNYIGGNPICPSCRELNEQTFKKVKEYLYNNPGATLSEVSTVLEVSVEKIKGYLKEGRLEIIGSDSNLVLECESCGKAIRTGRFCDDCSRDLTRDLKSTASEISETLSKKDSAKSQFGMRYLNKDILK